MVIRINGPALSVKVARQWRFKCDRVISGEWSASIKWCAQRNVRAARRPIAQCGERRSFLFRPRRHRRTDLCPSLPPPYACPPTHSFTQNSSFSSTCVYTSAVADVGFFKFVHWKLILTVNFKLC